MTTSPGDVPSEHDAAEREHDVQPVFDALRNEDPVVRTRALKSLGRMTNPSVTVIDGIARCLLDPDPMARSFAADSLGRHGHVARRHAVRVAELLQDPVPPVRFWAARALGALGSREPGVVAALEHAAVTEGPGASALQAAARRALARLSQASSAPLDCDDA